MKLYGKIENAVVLTLKREEGSGDFKGSYFHKIGLFFPETQELGELSCSEDIYNSCKDLVGDPSKRVSFDFCYNSDFKKLSIFNANASKSKA